MTPLEATLFIGALIQNGHDHVVKTSKDGTMEIEYKVDIGPIRVTTYPLITK